MPLLFAVLVFAALTALLSAGMSASSRIALDPVDPEAEERWLVDRLQRHPRLAAWVARRLDRRRAGGLALTVGFVAFLGTAALVGWLLSMVNAASGLATWDAAVAEWGASRADSGSIDVLRGVTELGSTWPVLVLLAGVGAHDFARRRNPAVPAFIATVGLGVLVLNHVLKLVIDRDRPDLEQLVAHAGSSFPSGHSATAAACWAAAALVLGRGRSRRIRALLTGAAALVAFSVAASRALLGVHWFTDVIAGVALGWGWFTLASVIFGGRLQRLGEPIERLQQQIGSLPGERSSLTVVPLAADRP